MECFNFQYAVKFVCGKPEEPVVAPGEYFTAINIHNPTESVIPFRFKVARALPIRHGPQPPSGFFDLKLGPDEALEIDCPDIMERGQIGGFGKGFVVIESDIDLDVVAVYTAAGGDGQVVSIHMERVPARRPLRLPQQG